ncbi:MAG: thiolase family protein [Caulobacteraceae bacterium]|nr:thiolase family protein [Caulobacteraceae bacterium]
MPQAVILSAARTAVGTSRKGTLADTTPEELGVPVVQAVLQRSGLDPALVDDVIFAESLYGGGVIARYLGVAAGLIGAGGVAVNRHCAGSLTTVGMAAAAIVSGMDRAIIAGGSQSASTQPSLRRRIPGTVDEVVDWYPMGTPPEEGVPANDMSIVVGWNTAVKAEISREAMDAWALRSHQRAAAAIDAGRFEGEIVPVMARMKDGTFKEFKVDEHPRRDGSMERMAALKPLHTEIEGFSITAGNSSGVNDAASALLLADAEFAAAQGLKPIAKVRGWAQAGVQPRDTGLAPITCIPKLLSRSGVKQSDIALWEINEAFASVPIAACKALGLDEETVNISGSGCSIGHPVAATGGRMLTTLINDLKRRGGGLGVATMCAGGGQAGAVLIEV